MQSTQGPGAGQFPRPEPQRRHLTNVVEGQPRAPPVPDAEQAPYPRYSLLAGQPRKGHGRGKPAEITRPRTGATVNRYTAALSTRVQHHMAAP